MKHPAGIVLFVLALLGLAATACDNAVSMLREAPEALFAVHGFLDTAADTQYVRVEALRPTVLPSPEPVLEATVTSTHLQTGATVRWHDARVTLDDGRTAHLLYAAFRPAPGGRYRLEVRRPDGQATVATTDVPAVPPLVPALPEGSGRFLVQRVTLQGLQRPVENVYVTYRLASARTGQPQALTVEYGDVGRPGDAGWEIRVLLMQDRDQLLRRFVALDEADTTLHFLGLRLGFTLRSPAWDAPPPASNIARGHGFFGAVGRYEVGWRLDAAALQALGFVDRQAGR